MKTFKVYHKFRTYVLRNHVTCAMLLKSCRANILKDIVSGYNTLFDGSKQKSGDNSSQEHIDSLDLHLFEYDNEENGPLDGSQVIANLGNGHEIVYLRAKHFYKPSE